ncbi:MAG TPA: response regulator [Smithella sp.]|nr:response regulator [Smithella sp.]
MSPQSKILLIEDNTDDVELTLRAFRKHRLAGEIIVKRDGQEALDYFFTANGKTSTQGQEPPSLVLLDLKLPKLSGLDVLKKIKGSEATKHIPVVILTSSREERDLHDSYRFGCNSYIRKPVDFDEFINVVKHLGIYWLEINEFPCP